MWCSISKLTVFIYHETCPPVLIPFRFGHNISITFILHVTTLVINIFVIVTTCFNFDRATNGYHQIMLQGMITINYNPSFFTFSVKYERPYPRSSVFKIEVRSFFPFSSTILFKDSKVAASILSTHTVKRMSIVALKSFPRRNPKYVLLCLISATIRPWLGFLWHEFRTDLHRFFNFWCKVTTLSFFTSLNSSISTSHGKLFCRAHTSSHYRRLWIIRVWLAHTRM